MNAFLQIFFEDADHDFWKQVVLIFSQMDG